MRSVVHMAPAAFIGILCRTIPRMLDHTCEDGSVSIGFLPQLVSVLGEGSFDAGAEQQRFAAFVRTGSRLGDSLRQSGKACKLSSQTGLVPSASLQKQPDVVLSECSMS